MTVTTSERLVHRVLREVVARRVTPGLAAAAGVLDSRGRVRARRRWATGVLGADDANPVSPDTVYDLASLTKVLSTTLLCAVAVTAGKLRLNETPWPWWPGVTVAHVLSHTAGLPAWVPLWRGADVVSCDTRRRALASLRAVALQARPGTRCVYSDVGFIALGLLLPRRLGGTLPTLFRRHADRWYGP
ncbi:MAG: serine hydrolase domain-containing protein, partial [Myxococcota bacterium]